MRGLKLQEYFYYTRTERNAALTLSVITFLFFLLPSFYPLFLPPEGEPDFSAFQLEITNVSQEFGSSAEPQALVTTRGEEQLPPSAELFPFDPNTAGKEEFIRLGLSPRLAQTLLNYRNKGGRFYKKEDLKKIYTLRPEDYTRLEPYIQIAVTTAPTKPVLHFADNEDRFSEGDRSPGKTYPTEKLPMKKVPLVIIDINQASEQEWQQLRGIGQHYAKRIVDFRERLGGFYSVEQVGETYGLPDSTFQQVIASLRPSPVIRRIAINSCSLDELKAHPYISNYQAKVLINYREQHGSFKGMEGLKKAGVGFKESDWLRLEPYLNFE